MSTRRHPDGLLSTASWIRDDATLESYKHGLATFPDVRQSERDLAQARTLDEAARAQVWTQAAAFAFSTATWRGRSRATPFRDPRGRS